MKKKDNDYSIFLVAIMLWLMICSMAQCSISDNLEETNRKLSDIEYELRMLRYK